MPYFLTENRHRFCTETATWLERNKGFTFSAAIKRVMANYELMAGWLTEGWTAERAGTELLRLEQEAGESCT